MVPPCVLDVQVRAAPAPRLPPRPFTAAGCALPPPPLHLHPLPAPFLLAALSPPHDPPPVARAARARRPRPLRCAGLQDRPAARGAQPARRAARRRRRHRHHHGRHRRRHGGRHGGGGRRGLRGGQRLRLQAVPPARSPGEGPQHPFRTGRPLSRAAAPRRAPPLVPPHAPEPAAHLPALGARQAKRLHSPALVVTHHDGTMLPTRMSAPLHPTRSPSPHLRFDRIVRRRPPAPRPTVAVA